MPASNWSRTRTPSVRPNLRRASLACGLIFAFCGWVTTFQTRPHLDTSLWLPLVLLSIDRLQRKADGVSVSLAGVAFAEGLIVRSVIGDTLTICPPLVITGAEIDALFDRLTRALDRTLDWAKRERLLVN